MKKIYILLMLSACISNVSSVVYASENDVHTTEEIPLETEPYTEIQFISTTEYVVKRGKVIENKIYEKSNIPSPQKGMRVLYASDGAIEKILLENGEEPDYSELSDIKNVSTYTSIVNPIRKTVLLAEWGKDNRNKLYRKFNTALNKNYIYGTGKATTFSDKTGQADIKNKKGSVATKLAYDNCSVGKKLSVTAKTASGSYKTVTMTKTDAGGMPDAILDIWKTGVEYWGHEWKESFSMKGTTTYTYY